MTGLCIDCQKWLAAAARRVLGPMNKVDEYVAEHGVPALIICHQQDLAFLVAQVYSLPGWEDVVVRAAPSGACPRGQLFFSAVPEDEQAIGRI